jgi:hypothetical protein
LLFVDKHALIRLYDDDEERDHGQANFPFHDKVLQPLFGPGQMGAVLCKNHAVSASMNFACYRSGRAFTMRTVPPFTMVASAAMR